MHGQPEHADMEHVLRTALGSPKTKSAQHEALKEWCSERAIVERRPLNEAASDRDGESDDGGQPSGSKQGDDAELF